MRSWLSVLFCVLSVLSVCAQQVAPWTILNPKPSSGDIYDIAAVNDTTAFALDGHQMLITQDGGKTWKTKIELFSGGKIVFKDKIGYALASGGNFYISDQNGMEWKSFKVPNLNSPSGISIINADTIRVSDETRVYRSNDGGKTWSPSAAIGNDVVGNVAGTFFQTGKIGHAITSFGRVLKTVNGGTSWEKKYENISSYPQDITFTSKLVGFIVGGGWLMRTDNGGDTWGTYKNIDDAIRIQFISVDVGYILGVNKHLYKTMNGGTDWTTADLEDVGDSENFFEFSFNNEQHGFIGSLHFRNFYTKDGGTNWSAFEPIVTDFHWIQAVDDSILYAIGGNDVNSLGGAHPGKIYRSKDNGDNWRPVGNLTTAMWFDFVTHKIGYAVQGKDVYKTIDGGDTWNKVNTTAFTSETLWFTEFIDENIGFVCTGFGGATYKTVNGGADWQVVGPGSFGQIQFVTDQIGYARSNFTLENKIYKSVDAGSTWTPSYEVADHSLTALDFFDSQLGIIVGDAGVVYKTTNGGANWSKVTMTYGFYKSVRFVTDQIVYIIDETNGLMKSKDGGSSWAREILIGIGALNSHKRNAFIASTNGYLLRYTIGYDQLLGIGIVTAIPLSPTKASVSFSIATQYDVETLKVYARVGLTQNTLDKKVTLGEVKGITSKNFSFELEELQGNTAYLGEVYLEDGAKNIVATKSFSFTTPVVVGINDDTHRGIRVYPNPASRSINLSLSSSFEQASYDLKSMTGQLVQRGVAQSDTVLDVSELAQGMYLLTIDYQGKRSTIKVVKR